VFLRVKPCRAEGRRGKNSGSGATKQRMVAIRNFSVDALHWETVQREKAANAERTIVKKEGGGSQGGEVPPLGRKRAWFRQRELEHTCLFNKIEGRKPPYRRGGHPYSSGYGPKKNDNFQAR